MAWPLPSVADLAAFSGRPEVSYTSYVNSALLQAALMFTVMTERTAEEHDSMSPDDQQLADYGVMAMADYIYLRQPYQQIMAAPLQSETIGSYTYAKPFQEIARNAQAMEVTAERTGVDLFDLAVRMLAKRTRANGVFSGAITGFEYAGRDDQARVRWDEERGGWRLEGPADRDQLELQLFDINAETFSHDVS